MEVLSKAVQTEAFEDKVDAWLDWDKNPQTYEEIKMLRDTNGYTSLKQLLYIRLKFENSGIRGRMGAGFSRVNDLVIIETTQGLVSYLESIHSPDDVRQRGVAIGFDARYNSKRFAELTATTFLQRGIRVYLFSEICPIPFVPFCISVNKCVAGVMITASHHPKHDNGYKVYWERGLQIIPPHDENIHSHILQNLQPWEQAWDTTIIKNSKLCRDPLVQINGMYFKHLRRSLQSSKTAANKDSKTKVTYTAMHGVCNRFMVEAFKAGHFNPMVAVNEQRDPNPEFPTLENPNPEDKRSLEYAFRTALETDSSLILANDPDGDRLCVAERRFEDNDDDDEYDEDDEEPLWTTFTGNELGALLGWWSLYNYREKNPSGDLHNVYMVSSLVSSAAFFRGMAQAEGFNYIEEPSVGFKWIAHKSCELLDQGKTVLFGFDGSQGFMMGTTILDKDGISAGINVAALATHLETENKTMIEKIDELYNKYGRPIAIDSCFLSKDLTTIENFFHRLRNFLGAPSTYPESLDDGHYVVESVRDFRTGYDSSSVSQGDQELVLRDSTVTDMITFVFDNGVSLTIRDCGTEPKIKFYTSLTTQPGEVDIWTYTDILDEMVGAIVDELFQPKINDFTTEDD